MKRVTLLFFFVIQTYSRSPQQREGKWFGYTYTSTVLKSQYITSLIPSSCVQYAATLPPCRNVRLLNIPEGRFFFSNSIDAAENATNATQKTIETVNTTPLGWGEYLGIYAPTVTVTTIKLDVTKMVDPRTVLTYSVSGCRPSRLPLDLPKCPDNNNNISPTPSIGPVITSTVFQNNPSSETVNLDVGETNNGNEQNSVSTEALPTTPKRVVEKINNA